MAKGYTTLTKVENYILQDINATFGTQVNEWIASAEKIIDQMTGRNFIADTEATARFYNGDGTQDLLIDDAVEITKVELGEDDYGGIFTEIEATGANRYFLEPNNYSSLGVPITLISFRTKQSICGKQNVRITGKWGYSAAVPEDIEFAATVFVAGILNQHRQGGDQVKTEKIGNYSVSYNTDIQGDSWGDFERAVNILQNYKKLEI